jgi:hypothetical protein
MSRKHTIVVAGDVTIDWLIQTNVDWLSAAARAAQSNSENGLKPRRKNWQLYPGVQMDARAGGALLLAREVALACGASDGVRVLTHAVESIRNIPPDEILHSIVEVARASETIADKKPTVFRVARLDGFSGPPADSLRALRLPEDDEDADIVVLDDAGNAFRDDASAWPLALRTRGKKPIVVMKLARPLTAGALFQHVQSKHADRLVLVINADDLRAEGVSVSRRLSWERTARELVWQMRNNAELASLARLPSLIVRFGVEGAIHHASSDGNTTARLYYDPSLAEDVFRERVSGGMVGLTDAFIAALVARITREGLAGVREGIRDGIRCSRRFFMKGFGKNADALDYPGEDIFRAPMRDDETIVDAVIPPSSSIDSADPDFWCLLHALGEGGIEPAAHRLVLTGEGSALRNVPVGEFGGLRTVDRAEIESFRSIQNLTRQYLERRVTKRPLSLAVFGPPGSGKSFGVEQVAKSVAKITDARVEKLEFNLSQFETTRDLVGAFHRVRDEALMGGVPLVFFDEFDCNFDGPLGWLRYFLAPMQDGAFRDGDAMHPIGKAIFVFAGGLSATFARFSRTEFDERLSEADRVSEQKRFREAKGPDFVSRLRGYVNILGPNPDPARTDDRLYLIRRATILRSLLKRNWTSLIDPEDSNRLNIDEAVLRALIGVPEYKHGVRSMEAVLDMSVLSGRSVFEPAALPPLEQLDQHVDAEAFERLVLQGVLFTAARDAIAESIHEKYRRDHASDAARHPAAQKSWAELGEVFQRSNRGQADDIIRKLERVGCGYRPTRDGKAPAIKFSKKETELLAELEHERWMKEKLEAGYTYGPELNDELRSHPGLVPWAELPEDMREYDREAVAGIPEILSQARFEVYRL